MPAPEPWTAPALAEHLRDFASLTLPLDRWAPHRSHLAVTIVACRGRGLDDATGIVRQGIQALNAVIGVPASAYHETVTRLYVAVVHAMVRESDTGQPDADLVNLLTARLGASREERLRMWAHYYRDPEAVLASDAARTGWVPPDRGSALPDWLCGDQPPATTPSGSVERR